MFVYFSADSDSPTLLQLEAHQLCLFVRVPAQVVDGAFRTQTVDAAIVVHGEGLDGRLGDFQLFAFVVEQVHFEQVRRLVLVDHEDSVALLRHAEDDRVVEVW